MSDTEKHDVSEEGVSPGDSVEAQQADLTPEERLAAVEAEREDMRGRWLRAEAEMANLRNRTKREVDEARQYAVQKFARDVVEVAENLKRGLDSLPPPAPDEPEVVARLREGFEGIARSFVASLERNGVKAEDPTGRLFDANLHQAMAEQESGEHPSGTVLQAWTQGWTLNGRLLRPAMVVVTKAPAGDAPPIAHPGTRSQV
jgi:molecular chaperone GrpE